MENSGREAGRRNCEESKTCSEKCNGKCFKGLAVHPTTCSSPSSNSTSFSLISGLAPQGTEGTGSDKKEPESFTRLPAHTPACIHTCAHTRTRTSSLSRAAGCPRAHRLCQIASKTISEAESKATRTFTLLSFSPLSC